MVVRIPNDQAPRRLDALPRNTCSPRSGHNTLGVFTTNGAANVIGDRSVSLASMPAAVQQ